MSFVLILYFKLNNNFFEASAKTGKNIKEDYYSLFREILIDYKENEPKI